MSILSRISSFLVVLRFFTEKKDMKHSLDEVCVWDVVVIWTIGDAIASLLLTWKCPPMTTISRWSQSSIPFGNSLTSTNLLSWHWMPFYLVSLNFEITAIKKKKKVRITRKLYKQSCLWDTIILCSQGLRFLH